MPKQKKREADDNALRAFYEACGLAPKIIEGAIEARYEEPTKVAGRETDIAKRLRGQRIPPKMRRSK
jgi:hypothetical protein